MLPDKIKETGWQTTAVGMGLGTVTYVATLFGDNIGLTVETDLGAIAPALTLSLSMIFGGQGYRAVRMHQKNAQERIAEDAYPPVLEDEEEGPWD